MMFKVADRGDPSKSAPYDVTVQVDKFNFDSPRFIVPSTSGGSTILSSVSNRIVFTIIISK